MPEIPTEAVEAGAGALMVRSYRPMSAGEATTLAQTVLSAAAPHIRTQADAEIDRLVAVVEDLRARLADERAQMLADEGEPEPCPLDHSCNDGEPCDCRCPLHDCGIAECPSFQYVERVIERLKTEGRSHE